MKGDACQILCFENWKIVTQRTFSVLGGSINLGDLILQQICIEALFDGPNKTICCWYWSTNLQQMGEVREKTTAGTCDHLQTEFLDCKIIQLHALTAPCLCYAVASLRLSKRCLLLMYMNRSFAICILLDLCTFMRPKANAVCNWIVLEDQQFHFDLEKVRVMWL